MDRNKIALILGIVCIILTIAICVQVKTVEDAEKEIGKNTLSTNDGLRDEVLKLREKYNNEYKELETFKKIADQVIALDEEMTKLTDKQLQAKTEEFRKRLKEARDIREVSQKEVGKAIGVSRSAVCYYESGRSLPDMEQIEKIAEFLQVDIFWLLGKEYTGLIHREGNRIINLSKEDCDIIRAIHANPDLFKYLLDHPEERIAKISRLIRKQD